MHSYMRACFHWFLILRVKSSDTESNQGFIGVAHHESHKYHKHSLSGRVRCGFGCWV